LQTGERPNAGDPDICKFDLRQATSGCSQSCDGDGAATVARASPDDTNPFSEPTATEEINANV
jgi:hypothetical protein